MTSFARARDLLRDPLVARSVEILRAGQASSGAYVAAPSFRVYRYAWLRDGAFCAYALDLAGERDSSGRFHAWVAAAVERQRGLAEDALVRMGAGESPPADAVLPARFTLDGDREPREAVPWPNFQLDGYGIWLWTLEQHFGDDALPPPLARAADLCARYLAATWALPCWNSWEEYDGGEHASTLAAVAAGLDSASRLLGETGYHEVAGRVRRRLEERFVAGGRFTRGAGDERVDGSLLWLAVPFGVAPHEDPRVTETVRAVRADLAGPGGGVYRYRGDTYYGGGQWILLTCWLGWIDALAGRGDELARSREWVRAQAQPNGDLPEQVTEHAQAPEMVQPWIDRWGDVATPLLWSHAMYVVMEAAARDAAGSD